MIATAIDVLQIVFADIILSGDNALVIGMAAAGLAPSLRRKAIFIGMALAAGLRILFAAIASFLIAIPGILFFGGLLLAFVCWRFFRDLRTHHRRSAANAAVAETGALVDGDSDDGSRSFWRALVTIAVADVSMSIDNVVAVAAIARENTALLVFGLALAILFMAVFATLIMRVMTRYPWLSWAGLVFLIYLTAKMLLDGWPDVAVLLGLPGWTAV
ncbi:MAG: YjbE family putative metal transport protein [Paracoccaceae bacterium]|nr:YjbE family putative metal transport protein [Paracoccaceae bacterium]MDE2913255.1 YjbE family putative metal transport protein [Paracoccaceae bacterium]